MLWWAGCLELYTVLFISVYKVDRSWFYTAYEESKDHETFVMTHNGVVARRVAD